MQKRNPRTLFTLPLIALGLSSCGNFHGTNQSIWSEGMWLVPLLLFLASALFFVFAFKAHESGSKQQGRYGGHFYNEKTPYWKIPQFWFSVAFALIGIGVIIWQNLEK